MMMKKILSLILCLSLMLTAAAFAEAADDLFADFAGMEWCFSSGAGGWSTDLRIESDGTFTGEYHDSEMGDAADAYPGGTVYFCAFTGKLSLAEQLDDHTWKITVDKLEKVPGEEAIDDGIRFLPAEPYGISEGDTMILYAPGTPVSVLSEDMQFWAHLFDAETQPEELQDWFLMSEKNESGFVGYVPEEPQA